MEFCFGIFLFFNGAWILAFESGGAIRALMMCIHAYFNIWCEAKAGWSVFIKRRNAVYKISSLPEATSEQMSQYDDVCAICYQVKVCYFIYVRLCKVHSLIKYNYMFSRI